MEFDRMAVTRSSLCRCHFFHTRVGCVFVPGKNRPLNDTNCTHCHQVIGFALASSHCEKKSHRLMYLNSGRRKNWAQYWNRSSIEKKKREEKREIVMKSFAFVKRINYKKVGIISVVLILFSILFCIVFVPKFLKGQLKSVKSNLENWFSFLSIFVYISL